MLRGNVTAKFLRRYVVPRTASKDILTIYIIEPANLPANMVDAILVFGSVGMTLLLVGFAANLLGYLTRESWGYTSLNLLGAAILAAYAYLIRSPPFLILNVVWSCFALYKIVRMLQQQ